MAFEFEIDPVTGVCHETWTGTLTFDAILESIRARHAHPGFHEDTHRLIDLSQADGSPTRQEIRTLALMHRSSPYRGACALVVPRDHQQGTSQLFESIVRGTRPIGIFRSHEAASRWIEELPDDEPAEDA